MYTASVTQDHDHKDQASVISSPIESQAGGGTALEPRRSADALLVGTRRAALERRRRAPGPAPRPHARRAGRPERAAARRAKRALDHVRKLLADLARSPGPDSAGEPVTAAGRPIGRS